MSTSNGSPTASPPPAIPKSPFNEPSMEDILASIRRIIATDHYAVSPVETERTVDHAPPLALEDTSTVPHPAVAELVPPPEASAAALVEREDEASRYAFPDAEPPTLQVELEETHVHLGSEAAAPLNAAEEEKPPHLYAEADPVSDRDDDLEAGDPLLSAATGAVVSSTFQTLAESMLFQDPEMVERVTREAIRPLLKQWLDENLPTMVERLVRAEIERVARGGRNR